MEAGESGRSGALVKSRVEARQSIEHALAITQLQQMAGSFARAPLLKKSWNVLLLVQVTSQALSCSLQRIISSLSISI